MAPTSPLFPATALERVALATGVQGNRPFVDVALGNDLRIRIVHVAAGIDLVLHIGSGSAQAGRGELRNLIGALRTRGVPVARAEMRRSITAPTGLEARAVLR